MRGESMRSDLTAVEQSEALSLPAQEKDAAEGQKKARGRRTSGGRSCALVPEEKARSGRPATGTKLEWRDIASAMQFLALHCTHHCSAAPVTLLTIRRPDGAFACPLPFLHMALERPMGHHHQRRTMQYR
jgi:hypothetical protein